MHQRSPVRFRIKGTSVYVAPAAKASIGYEAASQAPRLSRWRASSSGPNSLVGEALPTLRARSRDSVRKNGLAHNAREALVANIVGTGIKPNFNTPDRAFNDELARLFAAWTDESDADGQLDFYGQQALAVGSMIDAGDSFARLRLRRPADVLTVPLQIQLLESEYCPNEKNELALNGNQIRQGVEFDAIGRRVAYHLYRQHPNDYIVNFAATDLTPARVPASEVLQLHDVDRNGMIRGVPWLSRALVKLYDLDQYDDAQLVRQKIAALFAGFVKSELPEGSEERLFEGQSDADADGSAMASLEPGTVQMLRPGQAMEFSKPPEPGNSYADFMREQKMGVAVAVGILYEQLTGDYSQVNDRTWRAAVNEFRRRCETWQHHIVVFQFCRPILQRWAAAAILSGRLKPPAGIDAAMIARADWLPPRWPYINPQQDVEAKRTEIRAGLTSRRREVAEDGYDIEALDLEIAADNKRADDLGLVLDSDPRKVSNAGLTQARPAGTEIPSTEVPDAGS